MSDAGPQTIEFETERLSFQRWQDRHRASFAALSADPEVMRFFPSTWTEATSNEAVDRWIADFDARGWSNWAVELRATGACIGFIGLSVPRRTLPCSPCVEIGWRLARPYWRQGFATEGALATLAIGFESIELPEIVSLTALINVPSRAVMERIGLRNANADFNHPGVPDDHPLQRHCLYRLTRAEWSHPRESQACI